jgi:AcrR family transcriptional regulator
MPKKRSYNQESVLSAAIEVIQRRGIENLSARSVAAQLGSSTAPVYGSFNSMAELENATLATAKERLLDYTGNPVTDLTFLNIGIGMVTFAREEPELFRALFFGESRKREILDDILMTCFDRMSEDEQLREVPTASKVELLDRMFMFAHGMASLVSVGLLSDSSDGYIRRILGDVGGLLIEDVIRGMQSQN